ncbi:MAG: CHASE2 domain-containing protein [Bacteroidaceae bacterium]|nr:CHASE2 domain-containing protein [Bacteroidaceae bacterium]
MIRKIAINFVGILLLAIGLSRLMTYDITALVSPGERVIDYHSSDFYQLVANSRNERQLDTNIVLVSADSLSRMEIALLLNDVALCNPSAIGLDVMYGFASDGDSLILEVLRQTPSLILPIGVEQWEDSAGWMTKEAYLLDDTDVEKRGVINLNIGSPYHVVRTFRPYYNTNKGRLPNFATALVQMAAPEKLEHLQQVMEEQENDAIHINYDAREYETLYPSEVLQHPEMLENKIVLIGNLYDPQDFHITPIDEYTSGLLIHAHALSTILDETYPTPAPKWIHWLLSVLLCISFVVASALSINYRAGNLFMRVFQLVLLLLVVLIGTMVFIYRHTIIELSFPLALIALGLLALDVWNGIIGLFKIKQLS